MDRWTFCKKGHVHWGTEGGAGILFRHTPKQGEPVYLLAQRAQSVDFGGTWGVPGGALRPGETPAIAARREAEEEIGEIPPFRTAAAVVQDCGGGWLFHLIIADVDAPFAAYCVRETDATGWYTLREMQNLSLHPELRNWINRSDTQLLA